MGLGGAGTGIQITMKLTPVELSIRASWAINCAVAYNASLPENDKEEVKHLLSTAKDFLDLLDRVKAYIEPPIQEEKGRSKAEKKDLKQEVREGEMMGD